VAAEECEQANIIHHPLIFRFFDFRHRMIFQNLWQPHGMTGAFFAFGIIPSVKMRQHFREMKSPAATVFNRSQNRANPKCAESRKSHFLKNRIFAFPRALDIQWMSV